MKQQKKFLLLKPPGNFYPLALSYVASTLEEHDFHYDFLDCSDSNADPASIIASGDYFAAGSGGFVADFIALQGVFERVKKADGDIKLIIGGHVTRDVNHEVLFTHIPVDVGVVGEAEITLPLLLDRIQQDSPDYSDLSGVIYRDPNGKVVKNPQRPRVDLGVHHVHPSLDLWDQLKNPPGTNVPVITGRGCSGSCAFCSPSFRKFMPRPFEDIFDDIEAVLSRFNCQEVEFWSEVLFEDEEMLVEFCAEYKKRIKRPFFCFMRVDAHPRILSHLRDAGCARMNIGAESGSNKVLKRMSKGITVEQTLTFVKEAKRVGFTNLYTGLMFGNEGEIEKDIRKTLDLGAELNIGSNFHFTVPYPGTAIYRRGVRAKRVPESEYEFLQIIPGLFFHHEFQTEALFVKNRDGRPILPNLTDIPDEHFVEVLHQAYIEYMQRHEIKNARLRIEGSNFFIAGNCGVCGSEVEFEYCPISPIVRNLRCPNVDKGTCCNAYMFHGHIYGIEEVRRYAADVASMLAPLKRIVFHGDNFNIKFLLDRDIFDVCLDNIVAMGTHVPERVGQYVYGDEYGNRTSNSKLIADDEIIAMEPEAILVALMPPHSLETRDKLVTMGYSKERIFLMCPPNLIPSPVVEEHAAADSVETEAKNGLWGRFWQLMRGRK